MTISMYQASVPVFVRGLTNLKAILEMALAHAQEKKIDDTVFVSARLYPDMLPLSGQIQIATDMARGTVARLLGSEPPKWDDNEKTMTELIARIDKTTDYLKTITPAQIDGTEGKAITRTIRGNPMTFAGVDYLQQFSIPNFYFHAATTYGLLRHNGIAVGKLDFLGKFA